MLVALALAVVLSACERSVSPLAPEAVLTPGTWGAADVRVVTSDSVTQVRVGCDEGTFIGQISLDATGRFSANGTWTQGFQAYFYSPHPVPAQMSGQVNGASLQFAIAAANGTTVISIGPRTAVLGAGSSFGACGV
jgi:hypothetical protein